ncbi:2OG-Fe(II) oxygenase [Chryseolinea sp. H1M3-3]|uniref:2OG-Fe(II) oxygenase n=1 Tax=Chryseolinea sp. H1M3-3 TaxID=3034144 RepID=UPI0023EB2B55|nr:2OG-Fe(II) oxygenase [Chryseolinea sp. H1M3-3]
MNSIFENIANGLAENGYAVVDHFLSDEEVKNILGLKEFKSGLDHFKKAGIGKNQSHHINESIRGDYIHWVDKSSADPFLRIYLNRLEQLIQFLNENLFLSLKDFEVHMTVYPAGSFYKRHLDQFNRDDHRKLSVICYLNEDWLENEGGQLRMFLPEGSVDFFPTAGRLICFRSDQVEHEVLPATRPRLSITGWILDQHAALKHL